MLACWRDLKPYPINQPLAVTEDGFMTFQGGGGGWWIFPGAFEIAHVCYRCKSALCVISSSGPQWLEIWEIILIPNHNFCKRFLGQPVLNRICSQDGKYLCVMLTDARKRKVTCLLSPWQQAPWQQPEVIMWTGLSAHCLIWCQSWSCYFLISSPDAASNLCYLPTNASSGVSLTN